MPQPALAMTVPTFMKAGSAQATGRRGREVIRLNQAHDPEALALEYGQARRIQIRDLLEEQSAEHIYGLLSGQTPWWVAFNEGEQVHQLPPDQVRGLTQAEIARMIEGIQIRARSQYQFFYEYYPLYSKYFDPRADRLPIHEAYEFINSEPMLQFLRRLTGRPEIVWADCHATLFRAGHFLKFHTDEKPEDRRVAAYVINFTKGWGRDWGGFLQFWDQRYDVEHAYRPVFNALNIFNVPMDHSVNQVASYAPGLRFSLTGWLRADQPPGPIAG
jgi:SM-20-related protein